MSEIDTGGSAFPIEGGPNSMLLPASGLTKREWFAGMALVALKIDVGHSYQYLSDTVSEAYVYADAMIRANRGPLQGDSNG